MTVEARQRRAQKKAAPFRGGLFRSLRAYRSGQLLSSASAPLVISMSSFVMAS